MRLLAAGLTFALIAGPATLARADGDAELVAQHLKPILSADGAGGAAVALHIGGRTLFFNYGWADRAKRRPMTPDVLLNLASVGKVFDATLLALAVQAGEVAFDDPVVKYIPELAEGGDIRRVTLGQLASHTSGLLLRQDYPPWPDEHFTLADFIRTLNEWKAKHEPGSYREYTSAGYVLLRLALARRFHAPVGAMIHERILKPLGLDSTATPLREGPNPRGNLRPALKQRAAQGYTQYGEPFGEPGDGQGYYLWHGTAPMFSSARDMAVFLSACLGERPHTDRALQDAIDLAQRGFYTLIPGVVQALAWEILTMDGITVVDKLGGLDETSSYIGMVPDKKLGLVILSNRGYQDAAEAGRTILRALARRLQ